MMKDQFANYVVQKVRIVDEDEKPTNTQESFCVTDWKDRSD